MTGFGFAHPWALLLLPLDLQSVNARESELVLLAWTVAFAARPEFVIWLPVNETPLSAMGRKTIWGTSIP